MLYNSGQNGSIANDDFARKKYINASCLHFFIFFQFIVANLAYSDEDDLSGACSKLHSKDNIDNG